MPTSCRSNENRTSSMRFPRVWRPSVSPAATSQSLFHDQRRVRVQAVTRLCFRGRYGSAHFSRLHHASIASGQTSLQSVPLQLTQEQPGLGHRRPSLEPFATRRSYRVGACRKYAPKPTTRFCFPANQEPLCNRNLSVSAYSSSFAVLDRPHCATSFGSSILAAPSGEI